MKYMRTAQYDAAVQTHNPLDGKSNIQARTMVNNIIHNLPFNRLFSDESWEGVQQVWKVLTDYGFDWMMTNSEYIKNNKGTPISKQWLFEIKFTNNKGRPTVLHGNLTAHGAGSVQDPLDKYDVTVQVF